MCDFYSAIGRQIGQLPEIYHDQTNSHSGMIEKCGWRVNQPNAKTLIFEFECKEEILLSDCDLFEKASSLIRNFGECPESLVKKFVAQAVKIRAFLKEEKGGEFFTDWEKWGDVLAKCSKLPENVTFPKECGYLDLNGLKELPENVTFPKECGSLYLNDLKELPENVTFPKECGSLYLNGLKELPENVTFPEKIGGYLDLNDLKELPENVTFPKECGSLYLNGLKELPENVTFPKECGSLYLNGDLKYKMKSCKPAKKTK